MKKFFTTGLIISNLMISAQAADSKQVSFERFDRLNKASKTSKGGSNWVGLKFKKGSKGRRRLKYRIDSEVRASVGGKGLNFSLSEAYAEYGWGRKHQLSVGRKVLDWSPNEKYWLLGNLNGNQGFNLLGDKQEGLTGALYTHRRGKARFQVFASFLAIPSLNPSIKVKDGKITSSSNWAALPPSSTSINGKSVPIFYELNDPKISELLFKPSLGAHTSYRLWRGNAYAYGIYKPENKVRTNGEAFYDQDKEQVVTKSDPFTNHHVMYGVGTRQKLGDVDVHASLDVIDPNVKTDSEARTFESEFFTIAPRYDRESYFHTSAKVNRGIYDFSLNYIHLLSSNTRGSDDFLSETVKWKQAIGFNLNYSFSDRFGVLFDIKYDLARKDNIIKSELAYLFTKNLQLSLGIEFLKAPLENSYWSVYRANDTVYSKLDYQF